MNFFEAALLGLIQGLTEFLPISSSGHLVIAQKLIGLSQAPVAFDIYLHLATLAAVTYYFRSYFKTINRHLIIILIIATIPAVIFGLAIKSALDLLFNSLLLTSVGFAISAAFIFLSDRIKSGGINLEKITYKKSLVIGIYQAIAIIPSISRSGATLYAGLKSGLQRETALTFAFLISVPAVLGAVAFEWLKLDKSASVPLGPTLVGMAIAFIVGFYCLKLLKKLFLSSHLYYFGWYCLLLAAVTFIWGLEAIMK